ncbi:helix-turn-helix domain-containing protein [Lentzea nigeriaca]|uniref:hypothetical protein n=1 Tax=Lentzea nigeriaca TaxID=1128665 RepID=UPI001EF763A7|nr:hypothetical protein [Lentzea nigeriaca]MBM7864268.1 hypothetical protein [Lentzea nigeriaca]
MAPFQLVKNYLSSLLHKLVFDRRTEAGVYAARRRRTHPGTFGRIPEQFFALW